MRADTGFPMNLADVQSAPAPNLLFKLRTWLAQENSACLMHPHGFYVVLLDRTETEEWRFHLWPKGIRKTVGMPAFIHTHDRHVESRVLQGELTNILYDVRDVMTDGRPLYNVDYGGDRYAASTSNFLRKSKNRVEPVVRLRETVRQGGMYRVDRHTYHEAVVPESLTTVTLVCLHGRSPGTVNVVGLDGYPEMISFVRAEHQAQEFLEFIAT
jgi:hypothetical protein